MCVDAISTFVQSQTEAVQNFYTTNVKPTVRDIGFVIHGTIGDVATIVTNFYLANERRIVNWTSETFSPQLGETVRKIMRSLPIIVAYHLLPGSLWIPCVVGYAVVHVVGKCLGHPQLLSDENYANLYNGLGYGAALDMVFESCKFFVGNRLRIVTVVIAGIMANLFFSRAQDHEQAARGQFARIDAALPVAPPLSSSSSSSSSSSALPALSSSSSSSEPRVEEIPAAVASNGASQGSSSSVTLSASSSSSVSRVEEIPAAVATSAASQGAAVSGALSVSSSAPAEPVRDVGVSRAALQDGSISSSIGSVSAAAVNSSISSLSTDSSDTEAGSVSTSIGAISSSSSSSV